MEIKTLNAEPLSVADRTVTGVGAVMGNIDLGQDRIHLGAFKKTLHEQKSNIRFLWNHHASEMPTAVIRDIHEVNRADLPDSIKSRFPEATGGLVVAREYLDTPRGNEALACVKSGAVNGMSFGYDPVKHNREKSADGNAFIRNLWELKLYELSDVNWPMNEATVAQKSGLFWELAMAISAGSDITDLLQAAQSVTPAQLDQIAASLDMLTDLLVAAAQQDDDDSGGSSGYPLMLMSAPNVARLHKAQRKFSLLIKGAIPYKKTPLADEGASWDGPGEVAKASVDDLKIMCAWVDSGNPDVKGSYKLPHHMADGKHETVWAGVSAAMGALLGARGGAKIPDGDRKGVYNHLAKHYEEFGKDTPDFKLVELAGVVDQARDLVDNGVEFKDGRVLSQSNLEKLKHALEVLQSILMAAEPPDKALTDREKALRMQIALLKQRSEFDGY